MTLEAVGIGRRAKGRWLLRDIGLSLGDGDRLALVGPTGSGKTLLLRCLALLDPLDAGEIRWQGSRVRGKQIPKFRGQVIYLHQKPSLVEGSVEEILRQPFLLGVHREREFNRARIVELLDSLGRGEEFLAKRQAELSGGETQLTALLRAIQLDPRVLLLDEPTAALDPTAAELVETVVGNWLGEQPDARAAVWVTHDREQARRVSTDVLQIRDGHFV